ncbi:MAG: ParB/RepB/Spo0J family partition protein [Candidatus Competibacteraceae bacterium]|nr:ParB/RepB/Spo0J family partition protein [Candidatus Competibacteraceae bacterium]
MTNNRKQALGKGLSALLSGNTSEEEILIKNIPSRSEAGVAMVDVSKIVTNPFQPRTEFEQEALEELAESIRTHGIIQPITLRKISDNQYQLISGERRFRASQLAGLTEIPAYIRTADDQAMLEMALIENIQREDLNAIEVALSYQRLMEECDITQEQLSNRVAKKRSTITNYLRLLKLPATIQQAIRQGSISMGHARALINAGSEKEQMSIYEKILSEGLSVRQVEALVSKKSNVSKKKPDSPSTSKPSSSSTNSERQKTFKLYGDKLSAIIERPISILQNDNGEGVITIEFDTDEQLEKIIAFFDQE